MKFGSGGSASSDPNFGPSDTDKLGWHYLHTSEGWIDFGHFSNAAYYQGYVGITPTKLGGHGVEVVQGLFNIFPGLPTASKTSAYTREDYRSNRLGAEFGDFIDFMEWRELIGGCKCKSLSGALNAFLSDYNPSENPNTAPDFFNLPETQDELDKRKYFENLGNAAKNGIVNGIPGFFQTVFTPSWTAQ